MLKVTVTGAAGKMGGANIRVISSDENAVLSGAVEASGNPDLGRTPARSAGSAEVFQFP